MNDTGSMLPHDWFPRPLPGHVTLGEASWCYSSFAFLHCRSRAPGRITVGAHSGIYNGTFFNNGPDADITIGDYATLVGAIIATNGDVHIGHYCFLAHEVVLADGDFALPGGAGMNTPDDRRGIVLGDNCWVGMRAVIIGPVTIGEGAIVGAAAVVRDDVPPYAIVTGNPARITGWARPS